MVIENLDLETRSKIYNYTKKVLRKYQKGIVTGKLTADKFADNILSNGSIKGLIDDGILEHEGFKDSYINYIQALITMQNGGAQNPKSKKRKATPEKPSIPQKIQLKNLLDNSTFTLSMPMEYLNADDVDAIIKYVSTGCIDIGNERIYKYVHKPNLN